MGSSPSKEEEVLFEEDVKPINTRAETVDDANKAGSRKGSSVFDEGSTDYEFKPRRRSKANLGNGINSPDSVRTTSENGHNRTPAPESIPNIHVPGTYYKNNLSIDERPASEIIRERKAQVDTEQRRRQSLIRQQREVEMIKSERIHSLTLQLELKLKEITQKYRDADFTPSQLIRAHDKLNTAFKWADNRSVSLHQNRGLTRELENAKRERARTKKRLAGVTALRVMTDSPVATILGDPRGAEDVAERLTSVFEVQWSAVYEKTEQYYRTKHRRTLTDAEVTQSLRDILHYCYNKCKYLAEHQRDTLRHHLLLSWQQASSSEHMPALDVRIKELQTNLVPYYLHRVTKTIKSSIADEPTVSLVVHHRELCYVAPLENYLDMCTELCWLSQLRDPPIHMEFLEKFEPAQYRPYSQSGPRVDYIVWPVLQYYETGPVVCKGVAEFTDTYYYDQHKQVYHFDRRESKSRSRSRSIISS